MKCPSWPKDSCPGIHWPYAEISSGYTIRNQRRFERIRLPRGTAVLHRREAGDQVPQVASM
jgi:hypothetical protein